MKEAKDNLHVIYLEEEAIKRFTKLHNHQGNTLNKINSLEENYLKLLPEILEGVKAIYSEMKGKEVDIFDIIEDLSNRLKTVEEWIIDRYEERERGQKILRDYDEEKKKEEEDE